VKQCGGGVLSALEEGLKDSSEGAASNQHKSSLDADCDKAFDAA